MSSDVRKIDASPYSRTLKQYSIDEKLQIISHAKSHGNRAAGREFNVAESSIREWRKNELKLINHKNNGPGSSGPTGQNGGGGNVVSNNNNNNVTNRNGSLHPFQSRITDRDLFRMGIQQLAHLTIMNMSYNGLSNFNFIIQQAQQHQQHLQQQQLQQQQQKQKQSSQSSTSSSSPDSTSGSAVGTPSSVSSSSTPPPSTSPAPATSGSGRRKLRNPQKILSEEHEQEDESI